MRKEISRLVGILLGFSLLLGWVVGSSPKDSAALANEELTPWPFQNAFDLLETSNWAEFNSFLLDNLRIKTIATSGVNNLSIRATGMTISRDVIAGPIKLKENSIGNRNERPELFYAQDFTRACSELKNVKNAKSSLLKIEQLNDLGEAQIRFVIASNKSSFPVESNFWSNALLSCSVDVRKSILAITNNLANSNLLQVLPKNAWQSKDAPPYWSGDTHWTPQGALEVPRYLINEGLLKSTALERLETRSAHNGSRTEDLWALIGSKSEVDVSFIRPTRPSQTKELATKTDMRHFQTQEDVNVDSRSILFVYDSFGFVPELENQIAPMYRESYFVTWSDFDPKQLPLVDIIVFESVERSALGRLSALQELGENMNLGMYLKK